MDTRKAILSYQYSERMKSGLIIGTQLLEQLFSLKSEEEFSGAKKLLVCYIEGLIRELRIAENVLGKTEYGDLERKLMELIGRIQLSQYEEAQRSFSESLSLVTTSCQNSMTYLIEKKLV